MEEIDNVAGLGEWMALQTWLANWRPEADPTRSVEALSLVLLRAMRAGYVAYLIGVKAMPELFALDQSLARMWQEGYASARTDAGFGVIHPVA
ncbi:hypothetical protein [Pseudoduganella ginsengisoli]|uniref:Uncharacterized protein n=1 Tax=Pseudoduganella ginsengisoli TaxID=1462440 RepID=A0A6L6PZW4_9BURK|nr:hypothetical protein [Pseudoduganella ginsengisoli]MTW02704.1 hypothetical protein [Pseudoduganella ginsengisoli]